MCELFAVNSKEPVDVTRYLRVFYQHSALHPHGWGLCWREDDGIVLHKEPTRALDSAYLGGLLKGPIAQTRLLAHIRLATLGRIAYENCHPFICSDSDGAEWMMIHNGTIFNDALIAGYEKRSKGSTDSERVTLFLMDVLNAAEARSGAGLGFDALFDTLSSALTKLSNGNKLNIILDDGEYTYVHTNTMEKTLYVKQEGNVALFSTQPLDGNPRWEPVPTAQLQAYRDGRLVRQGKPHANIFVECAIENYLLLQSSA